jgi:hypothetical protein
MIIPSCDNHMEQAKKLHGQNIERFLSIHAVLIVITMMLNVKSRENMACKRIMLQIIMEKHLKTIKAVIVPSDISYSIILLLKIQHALI